jgi:hypothetical protein
MAHLVIIHGVKGGVGKSIVAIALIGHLHVAFPSDAVEIFDMDGILGDTIAHFPSAAAISRNLDDLGGVLDRLLGDGGPEVAVIDTCANADLDRWLIDCGPGLAAREGRLVLHVFWVVDGTPRSATALAGAHAKWAGAQLPVKLTVLRNLGVNQLFQFDQHPISGMLAAEGTPIVDVAVCDEAALAEAVASRVGFHGYAAGQKPNTAYSRRMTVSSWLRSLGPVFERLPFLAETDG